MKTRIFSALLFTVSFFFLWGCAPKGWQQSQDEYKKGNIHAAVQWAAATLVEKPNYEDAILFLQKVLPEIYDDYLKQSKVSESKKDWDQAVLIYKNIVWFGEVVAKIPPQINEDTKEKIVFATLDVSEELENATNKAAEAHYNKGLSFENSSKSKEAAKEYSKAIEYVPGYKDAEERYERMRSDAIKRVAVMPFENLSGKTEFGMIGENISDQCISVVMSDNKNLEFLEFITRDRLDNLMIEKQLGESGKLDVKSASDAGKVLGINYFIFGKINSVTLNQPPETKVQVPQEKTYTNKNGYPYTVSALVTVTTRKATASVKCSYQIIDANKGTIIKSGTVSGDVDVSIQFGRFRGNENALDSYYSLLCSYEEKYPPSSDILVNQAVEELTHKLGNELADYFK